MKTTFIRITIIAFFISMWNCKIHAESDLDQHTTKDRSLAISLFDRISSGKLLRERGNSLTRQYPLITSGPAIIIKDRVFYLDDIRFTANVICNLGLDGIEECYRQLDGSNQTARIVAIYALHIAFESDSNEILISQAPMLGVDGSKPRDLNPDEIKKLKDYFGEKIVAYRNNAK